MGLLDLFKQKDKDAEYFSEKTTIKPECDLAKTQVIIDLLTTPKAERDEHWNELFFENIQTASFVESIPQLIIGPDGFPYFVLKTMEKYNPFESFCINNMKDDILLEKGLGVVINPEGNDADWVFSYGDIINLHLNKKFIIPSQNINFKNNEKIKKGDEVIISQPSENYLPALARNVMKIFLQNLGIKQPKIMMISRTIEGIATQEIVFNLFEDDFLSFDDFNLCLLQLSWFLPKHYLIGSIPKNSEFVKKFENL